MSAGTGRVFWPFDFIFVKVILFTICYLIIFIFSVALLLLVSFKRILIPVWVILLAKMCENVMKSVELHHFARRHQNQRLLE